MKRLIVSLGSLLFLGIGLWVIASAEGVVAQTSAISQLSSLALPPDQARPKQVQPVPPAAHTLYQPDCGPDWTVVPSPNVGTSYNSLHGVTAVSANDVWAVGSYT